MCGIAGLVDLQGKRSFDPAVLDRMVDALYLRGPDDRGVSIHDSVAMGIRRLSIIDIEGGHQPMTDHTGDIRVVMNGEIYNFQELRSQLISSGYQFKTRSDTEVLVHGYLEWGLEGLLCRLNGMFAFALQDVQSNLVFLVRDRMGIKPLLYFENRDTLVFGSGISALLHSELVPIEPDPMGVRLYLQYQFIPWPYTAIRGVKKLPPAHYLRIHDGKIDAPQRYWQAPAQPVLGKRLDDWAAELRELLSDAVRLHMVGDVEVGAFLSGGVDSSMILGLMTEHSTRPVKAFSIGFEDRTNCDETPFARAAAQRFAAEFHSRLFTDKDVEDLTLRVIQHLEEPIGDPACLPTFLLSQIASEQVKVILTGEGADELFAGYGYYRKLPPRRANGKKNLGLPILKKWRALLSGSGSEHRIYLSRRFNSRSSQSGYPYATHADFVDLAILDLPLPNGEEFAEIPRTMEMEWLHSPEPATPLGSALRTDCTGWLPDNLLMKVDRTTMAHSLEARVPFLDYRVVEHAMTMPDNVKIRDQELKVVLRKAAAGIIGEEPANRKKHGFNLPLSRWFRSELRVMVDERLGRDSIARVPWINLEAVEAVLQAHSAGRGDFSRQIWLIMVLVTWFQEIRARHPKSVSVPT